MKNVLVPANQTHEMINTLRYAVSLGVKNSSKLFFLVASNDRMDAVQYVNDVYHSLGLTADDSHCEIIVENQPIDNEQIKKATIDNKIDLVLIGANQDAHNISFFGTQISHLISSLSCSVLSIPYGYNNLQLNRIGYATELDDFHARVKDIVPFARLFGASIEACHVYPVFPQKVNVLKYDIKHALMQVRSENNFDKIDLHFIKTPFNNEPVRGIREFINLYKPDMLVMFHRPRVVFDTITMDQSATEAVVKLSPIPILAINSATNCILP